MRMLIAAAGVSLLAAPAAAQFPAQPGPGTGGAGVVPINPSAIMPNIYNPLNQPLSPYLNLLRGGNPGVNYFFGVRPGTIGGFGAFGGGPFMATGGSRPPFFPQLVTPDPAAGGPLGPTVILPPAGHAVVFNNTLGFFPGPAGQAGGARTGTSGLGARPRPPKN